jgi:hypothetical protein
LSVSRIRRRFSSISASTRSCSLLDNIEIAVNDDASTRKLLGKLVIAQLFRIGGNLDPHLIAP